ncbi:MAG: antibiotic biosynthesis monooxygenase [Pseudomonadota bacterium]
MRSRNKKITQKRHWSSENWVGYITRAYGWSVVRGSFDLDFDQSIDFRLVSEKNKAIAVCFFSNLALPQQPDYEKAAQDMENLAALQQGYIDFLSIRAPHGSNMLVEGGYHGCAMSIWENEDAIKAWYHQDEHKKARLRGRDKWYQNYEIWVVAIIE